MRAYQKFVQSGEIKPGVAQDQSVALHYRDTELYRVVMSQQNQSAYDVGFDGEKVVEQQIDAEKIN